MKTRNNLFASVILLSLMFFSVNSSHAQTNFFYYHGEKVILNVKSSQISIIFSESTTKSNARDLLSKYDIKGDMKQIKNVALAAFYTLKFNGQKDIQNIITKLKSEEDIIWVNPVFERKGTEFKVYNRFVAKLTSIVSQEQIESLNKKHHVKLIRESGTGRYTFELSEHSDLPVMDMANQYYKELNAEWAMPDFIVPFEFYSTINDEYYPFQFNYNNTGQEGGTPDADIDAPQAWNISKGSSDIIIAVIDNGVEVHPDLPAERMVTGYDCVHPDPNDPLNNTGSYKNEAHGMACAGLIAASHNSIGIAGLAPECKIMPIQHSGEDDKITSLNNIAAAFDYACENGADIISNSWGGEHDVNDPPFVYLREAIEEAMALGRDGKGCVVLFSAGNEDKNYIANTLATIDGVIAVGASNKNDYQTWYSNEGTELDVVAPSSDDGKHKIGTHSCSDNNKPDYESDCASTIPADGYIVWELRGNIWTMDIKNEDGSYGGYNRSGDFCPERHNRYNQVELDRSGNWTAYFGGTSASCPQVAGLATLILSVNNDLYYYEVDHIIRNTADKIHSNIYNYNWNPEKPGHSKEVGYGRINAYEALNYTLEHYHNVNGAISSNTTWSGYKYVTGDITVNSGVTLTIEPGTAIFFNDGKKMVINGQLTANGTESNPIRFTSLNENPSAGDWYGIKLSDSNSSANLNHCEIEYAVSGIWTYYSTNISITNSTIANNYYGIYSYKSLPNVQSNLIQNNYYYGIYLYRTNEVSGRSNILNNQILSNNSGTGIYMYKSSPEIRGNEVSNVSTGLRCLYYSSPRLGKIDNYGNNNIHNTFVGLNSVEYSNPFLGLQDCNINGGYNQFTSNSAGHIWADRYCYIDAEQNWWGSNPPQSSMFDAFDHSSIDYNPWLTNPVFNMSASQNNPEVELFNLALKENDMVKNIEIQDLDVMKDFKETWSLKRKLLFARALLFIGYPQYTVAICENIIYQYPDSAMSYFALDLLWQTAKDGKQQSDFNFDTFINYLNKASEERSDKIISGYMRLISASFDEKNELIMINETLNEYRDTKLIQSAQFQKFMYYLHDKENRLFAEQILSKMKSQFPNSSLIKIAEQELNNNGSVFAKHVVKGDLIEKKNTLPNKYKLYDSFPNPFNPSTTIRYTLPVTSNVSIEIYNSAGQKIRDFHIQSQNTGTQELIWNGKNNNGSNIASGIYILRFCAQSLEVENDSFSKSIKLLLIR